MRLIDADALHETIAYAFSNGHDDPNGNMLGNMIDEAPTISSKDLVRHGKWISVNNISSGFRFGTRWYCSECGKTIHIMQNAPEGYDYCPHCGCKVDDCADPHVPTKYEMEKILLYTKNPVRLEDVFVFEIQLATNEVDKDEEYFSPECLWSMQWLFLGKRGISNIWQNSLVAPIIFDTRIENNELINTKSGECLAILFAKAFVLKTDENKQFISDIENGKIPEVSVSISFGKNVCNICGQSSCQHKVGGNYNGKTCYRALCEPRDVLEWAVVKQVRKKVKVRRTH